MPEPNARWPHRQDLLGTLVVGLGGILQPAGVLDGDRVALLGDGTRALRDDSLGNTHDSWCVREVSAGCGKECQAVGWVVADEDLLCGSAEFWEEERHWGG